MTADQTRLAVLEANASRAHSDIQDLRVSTGQILTGITEIKVTLATLSTTQSAQKDSAARSMSLLALLGAGLSGAVQLLGILKGH